MGVKDLWPIIHAVEEAITAEDLTKNKHGTCKVAVDLSAWIVDSQCVKQMAGVVTNPHLR